LNIYFVIAATLAVLVGVIHSILGEVLIFNKLRAGGLIPALSPHPLQARNIRIIWATWHLASVFGFASAAILFSLADREPPQSATTINALIIAFGLSGLLVLIATNGRHPGWFGLFAVAIFTFLGGFF
jgi:hypothetical protein